MLTKLLAVKIGKSPLCYIQDILKANFGWVKFWRIDYHSSNSPIVYRYNISPHKIYIWVKITYKGRFLSRIVFGIGEEFYMHYVVKPIHSYASLYI